MTIIRYEDAKGNGPYASVTLGFSARHANKLTPTQDGLGNLANNKRSGFTTVAQLEAWFTQVEQNQMSTLGFERVTYEVPTQDVKYSNEQALYIIDRAVMVDTEHE